MTLMASVPFRPLARGDIVLAMFPFSTLLSSKRRPAVIVAEDALFGDFTLAFITSQQTASASAGEAVLLPSHPEFALTGLAVPSKIRPVKMVTLAPSLLTRRLGRLGPLLTADLDLALIAAFGITTT